MMPCPCRNRVSPHDQQRNIDMLADRFLERGHIPLGYEEYWPMTEAAREAIEAAEG